MSKAIGPEIGPPQQDLLFNNERCVVVPPGIVNEILKKLQPLSEYKRSGNLYVGKFRMLGFARPGLKA